jgi:IS5 family transposase
LVWMVERMGVRFRPGGKDSFWGDCVYDVVVPKRHFLRQLATLLDWEGLTGHLIEYYKGGGEYGPPPYHPATLFKMLLLAYIYKLSEREVEAYVSDSLAARFFLGLAANEPAPDHSSLSVFRERILSKAGPEAFRVLFNKVLGEARAKGITFGQIQVVDATHSVADVAVSEENKRGQDGQPPRDGDASWGTKGRKKVKTASGEMVTVRKTFFGYKAHISVNAESGLVTAVVVTTGRETDGQQFPKLLAQDRAVGVEAKIYTGDKGYDDGANHSLLWSLGKQSALVLNKYRTAKKDGNKGPWLALVSSEGYAAGKRERYKVEQKFAEGKRQHGWGRCRHLGLAKYAVQSLLTALVLNLKRMTLLLTGVRLRNPNLRPALV